MPVTRIAETALRTGKSRSGGSRLDAASTSIAKTRTPIVCEVATVAPSPMACRVSPRVPTR